jgi:hypothetical protein
VSEFDDDVWEMSLGYDGPTDDRGSCWDPADFKTNCVRYGSCIRKTTKAVCISFAGRQVWLPLSRVVLVEQLNLVRLPRWLIDKHNLRDHVIDSVTAASVGEG